MSAWEFRFDLQMRILQVKRVEAHRAAVNQICFDEAAEFIASCSDDGSVAVRTSVATRCCFSVLLHFALIDARAQPVAADLRQLQFLVTTSLSLSCMLVCLQVQGFYTDETVNFKYKRPVKVRT